MDNFVRLNRPTIRQLEYAVAVGAKRHFSRAAEACDVSQPALSAQLMALESLLGVTLFERSRRGVMATPEGERLLPLAEAALRAVDAMVEGAAASRDPLAGDLRLGVIPTVAPYLLPHVMPPLRKAYPRLRCLLIEEKTETLLRRLRDGALDAALLAVPTDADDLFELGLFEEPFVVALRRDHRLAKKASLKVSDLAGQEVLLLDDGHCLRAQALEVCERAGSDEAAGLRATSLITLVQMVASGIGITLLPRLAADALVPRDRGELVTRPFGGRSPGRKIGLVWRRNSPRSETFRRVGDVIAAEAKRRST